MSTALLLIAHGSRHAEANDDTLHLADVLHQRGYAIVVASFLELAEPDIQVGGARCIALGATRVILTPYFLSAGVHVQRDLQDACVKLSARFPQVEFRLAEPLGRHPLVAEVVLDRVRAALTKGTIEAPEKVVARSPDQRF